MDVGLYMVALHDRPLERALDDMVRWGITRAEVAAGGFVPTPHCPRGELLADAGRRAAWLEEFGARGIFLSALNVNGNPLHPDRAVADAHSRDIEEAIELAPLVGVDRIIVMPGAPGSGPGAVRTGWYVAPWETGLLDARDYQWDVAVAFWRRMAERAAERGVRICVEAHPHTVVYNVDTMLRLLERVGSAALGVNLDPSHFFWQGIDPLRAIGRLRGRIWAAAAKDTLIDPEAVALHGVLDDRFSRAAVDPYPLGGGYTVTLPPEDAPWRFAAVGRGHDASWWRSFLGALADAGYGDAISIEHEDVQMKVDEAIPYAVRTLHAAGAGADRVDRAPSDINMY
ncbi:sugar phosphate isomerase/epimerase family protein [Microbacterium yannicii]|uniref:sugar phosphate isomerase/epimerase family protein n=1 Tax=Microbacterium yannicii TaxID=671622 RepID=UPI00031C7076|nr:sugar phosphate isomerase/epimerase [Microbacterium yannicii]